MTRRHVVCNWPHAMISVSLPVEGSLSDVVPRSKRPSERRIQHCQQPAFTTLQLVSWTPMEGRRARMPLIASVRSRMISEDLDRVISSCRPAEHPMDGRCPCMYQCDTTHCPVTQAFASFFRTLGLVFGWGGGGGVGGARGDS